MNFQIQFDLPIYILLSFGIVAAGLSYLMYRRLESLSGGRRTFLGLLRAFVIFLLLLAAANLVTSIVRFREKKREVIVLIDDSQSMTIKDGGSLRSEVIDRIIESKQLNNLRQYFDIAPVAFGEKVERGVLLDSLRYDQPATNMSSALVTASKIGSTNNVAFALLLTDGDYNDGGDPLDVARSLSFPVYTVGIGDSTQPADIVVRQVLPAPVIYAGKKSTVRAVISSHGFGGRNVYARLLEDGREVSSKQIILPQTGDVEASFDYEPTAQGMHVLTVSIPPQQGEFSKRNNSASSTADVRKGRFSILLIAGEPSADVAFLRRSIEESQDFDLNVLIQKSSSEFFQKDAGEILSTKYDAVCLYDFPNSHSVHTADEVSAILSRTDVPYVYFAGKNFSTSEVMKLPRLPFGPQSLQEGEFQVGISPAPTSSIPIGLQTLYSLIAANSNLFPPVYYQRTMVKLPQGSSVLAFPVLNGNVLNYPAMIVNERYRSAAFLAYGLWRLQLMSPVSGLSSDFLQDFVGTTLRTLLIAENQKLLSVETDKRIYDPSEAIDFRSILVDQTGSPVDGATVDVNVMKKGSQQSSADTRLSPAGDGSYVGSVTALGEGRYAFFAKATKGSELVGSDSGTIAVTALNREFIQPSMDPGTLRQIASMTGGKFMTASQLLNGDLHFDHSLETPVTLSSTRRLEVLSSLPILAAVVVILGIEWVMRKIWGLP